MDLSLNIRGDSSGATEALNDVGDAAGDAGENAAKSAVKWAALAAAAEATVKAVVKFGVDSVKAFADAERVQKQLERAAGAYSGALAEQATALSKLYAIDDDIIKQSQTLLVQWGGVGAATNEAEKAALNLAAAFGGDLKTATQDIIRNVESGGVGLAKMGIHFKVTGDKGKDFEAAVAAINSKLGGAAAADAGSLTGQLHAAELAFGDIQKTIGGSVSAFIEQTGAAGALTSALRNLNEFIGNEGAKKLLEDGERMTAWVSAQRDLAEAQLALREASADPTVGLTVLEMFSDDVDRAQAKVDALKASAAPLIGAAAGPAGTTNAGGKDRESDAKAHAEKMAALHEKNTEDWKQYLDGIDTLDAAAAAKDQQELVEALALEAKRVTDTIEERVAGQKAYDEIRLSEEKKAAEHAEKIFGIEKKKQDEAARDAVERTRKRAAEAESAANSIGAAFVNALADQLAKLSEGGELDIAVFIGDIIAAAIGVATVALSAAFPAFSGLIGAVGGLATVGVRAGAQGISADNKRRRAAGAASGSSYSYHSGGWVGDEVDIPRHHSGAWIGADEQRAILQTGERVLSRKEVSRIGGPGAVDAAAMGGGGPGVVVQIQAIDSKGAAESIESDFGKGMRRALRSGRGDFPALLGGAGPR
jgi:hypothetical protein